MRSAYSLEAWMKTWPEWMETDRFKEVWEILCSVEKKDLYYMRGVAVLILEDENWTGMQYDRQHIIDYHFDQRERLYNRNLSDLLGTGPFD